MQNTYNYIDDVVSPLLKERIKRNDENNPYNRD